jgi:hypothetical protein
MDTYKELRERLCQSTYHSTLVIQPSPRATRLQRRKVRRGSARAEKCDVRLSKLCVYDESTVVATRTSVVADAGI